MYEAINLARQIASSPLRSQANCSDTLEYRKMRPLRRLPLFLSLHPFPALCPSVRASPPRRPTVRGYLLGIDERTID